MKGKKWKVRKSEYSKLKKYLISLGGKVIHPKSKMSHRLWMVEVNDFHFTLFNNGTLYSYPSDNNELELLRNQISRLIGSSFIESDKKFVIGLDEAGVSEFFGNLVIASVCYPSNLHNKLEQIIGVSDTKKKHDFKYWKKLYFEIKKLESLGMMIFHKSITPDQIKLKNTQSILNNQYFIMLKEIIQKISIDNCRIVIDDFGIGEPLSYQLKLLQKSGISVTKEFHADDKFLESKAASVVAKYYRLYSMNILNRRYGFEGIPLGSGHPEDPLTVQWVKKWKKSNKNYPPFVRKAFGKI